MHSLQDLTGWSFTVLMGGPCPATGGKIETCGFHVGKTNLGYAFDQAYANYSSGIMAPYRGFLDRVYGESLDIMRLWTTD